MLILVLVLKDSLRTFFKSLSWSLGVRSLSLGSGPCPCGSGPCPYPGPCGLVLVLAFSPCKDLFPLFHYSDLLWYFCGARPVLTPGATPMCSTGNSASTGFWILCTSGPTLWDSIIISWPRFSPTSNTFHL